MLNSQRKIQQQHFDAKLQVLELNGFRFENFVSSQQDATPHTNMHVYVYIIQQIEI